MGRRLRVSPIRLVQTGRRFSPAGGWIVVRNRFYNAPDDTETREAPGNGSERYTRGVARRAQFPGLTNFP